MEPVIIKQPGGVAIEYEKIRNLYSADRPNLYFGPMATGDTWYALNLARRNSGPEMLAHEVGL